MIIPSCDEAKDIHQRNKRQLPIAELYSKIKKISLVKVGQEGL